MEHNVIIIGSGPAGYTAAIYLGRAGLNPVLVTGALAPGGQLVNTTEVENFPGFPDGIMGPDLMDRMRDQAEKFGTQFIADDVESVEQVEAADAADAPQPLYRLSLSDGSVLESRAIIVATGSNFRKLGVPGERELSGHGVSYCATCDGFFYRKKTVAVVGGGDTACEEAVYLAGLAAKVYLIVRKPYLRASKIMQERVMKHDKIEVLFEHNAVGLFGENGVEGVHLVQRMGEPDEKRYDVAIDGFFLAIGHKPNADIFKPYVDTDEVGYIVTEPGTPRTKVPGVFAAGDVADSHYRQAITAAGTGCQAAIEAERYLSAKGLI